MEMPRFRVCLAALCLFLIFSEQGRAEPVEAGGETGVVSTSYDKWYWGLGVGFVSMFPVAGDVRDKVTGTQEFINAYGVSPVFHVDIGIRWQFLLQPVFAWPSINTTHLEHRLGMDLPNSDLIGSAIGARYYPLILDTLFNRKLLRFGTALYFQGFGIGGDDTHRRSCPGWTNCTENWTGYSAYYNTIGYGVGLLARYDVLFRDFSRTPGKVNFWSFDLELRWCHNFITSMRGMWNDSQQYQGTEMDVYVTKTGSSKTIDIKDEKMSVHYIMLLLSSSLHF